MDASFLAEVEPSAVRRMVPEWLAAFIDDPERSDDAVGRLAALTAAWSDETCRSVADALVALGEAHQVYDAHPACRDVSRSWCRGVLIEPEVRHAERLEAAVERGPTLVVCNHQSYVDANATDAVLSWCGHEALADRMVAAAGPKVYQDLFRRFAAMCLNTIPVIQSTTLGHTEKLGPRELARRAKEGLNAAAEALERGRVVLIYPEGSRTRNGRLQPFVRGVHRWLSAVEGLQVVPMGLVGTNQVMPVGATRLRPGRVQITFGPALEVGRDGTSREVLASAHAAVGALLPPDLEPEPGHPPVA